MKNPNKLECFKRTKDDWCPNYKKNLVRLFYVPLTDGTFRVAVWGNDDLGMEFDYQDSRAALNIYEFLSKQKYINFDTCKKLGFYHA